MSDEETIKAAMGEDPSAGYRKIMERTGLGKFVVQRVMRETKLADSAGALGEFGDGRVQFGENFLSIPDDATDEEIRDTFRKIKRVASSFQWWIGDLICAVGRIRGEDRAQAILDQFEVSEKAAYRYWKVCRHVEHFQRRECSTFTHHEIALEECSDVASALEWVGRSVEEKWSATQMRQEIRDSKREPKLSPKPGGIAISTYLAPIYSAGKAAKKIDIGSLGEADRAALIEDTCDLWAFLCGLRGVDMGGIGGGAPR